MIYIHWLRNNPLKNMGSGVSAGVNELPYDVLELRSKCLCCPKFCLSLTLSLTTVFAQVRKLSFCSKLISAEFKI